MSISTVIGAFQAVNATITGVTSAPALAYYPTSLDTCKGPLALTFAGPGTPTLQSGSWAYHLRDYIVKVYVQPHALGVGWENYSTAATLLQAFIEKYLDDITLGGAIEHMGTGGPTIEDSGILDNIDETNWMGFEIRISTKEQIT